MSLSPSGGGSLLLAWQLKDKRVLVVGGGEVASSRVGSVLGADALITIICPHEGLHPITKHFIETSDRITYHDRLFQGPEDLVDMHMVLTAIDDVEWSRRICAMCRNLKIPVNVADIPPSCDFYFGSQIRRGPLQIMISTNGNGPKLANLIKQRVEKSLPHAVGAAVEKVGILRAKLRQRAPGVGGELGKKRMKWMTAICMAWDMDELAALNDATMEILLDKGWEKDSVPKPGEILARTTLVSEFPNLLFPTTVGFLLGAAATTAFFLLRRG